jgi:hypothetical protein
MSEKAPNYSREENQRKLSALLVFGEFMGKLSEHGLHQNLSKEDERRFVEADETLKQMATVDTRMKVLLRALYDAVAFTRGTEQGEVYVDNVSLIKVMKLFMFMSYVNGKTEIELDGYTIVNKESLEMGTLKDGFETFFEFYMDDEESPECQLVLWLLAVLSLQIADLTPEHVIFGIFGTPIPQPELKQ